MKAKSYKIAEDFVRELRDLCEEYDVYSINDHSGTGPSFTLSRDPRGKQYTFSMYNDWDANDNYRGVSWYLGQTVRKKQEEIK